MLSQIPTHKKKDKLFLVLFSTSKTIKKLNFLCCHICNCKHPSKFCIYPKICDTILKSLFESLTCGTKIQRQPSKRLVLSTDFKARCCLVVAEERKVKTFNMPKLDLCLVKGHDVGFHGVAEANEINQNSKSISEIEKKNQAYIVIAVLIWVNILVEVE